MQEKSLKDQIVDFLLGQFENGNADTQVDAGWFDWFCKDSVLKGKTKKLYKKVLQILKSSKIDVDSQYVIFKNNCPVYGNLYDDFRICDRETQDVIFTVTPSSGHTSEKGKASVHGRENNFQAPLVEGTWKDVVEWFLS
jgi:hypothetical protein